jgi:hypothetical protein
MQRLTTIVLGLLFGFIFISNGCSSKSNSILNIGNVDKIELHKIIHNAGDESGWKITEYKHNLMIAEKITDDGTIYSEIKIGDDKLEFTNPSQTNDLSETIRKKMLDK